MAELKPCPFCGGNVSRGIGIEGINFFNCHKCGAIVSFNNGYTNTHKNKAVGYWNTRANEKGGSK